MVGNINSSDKILVNADKTRNIYKMDRDEHDKLVTENIMQKYKKASEQVIEEIEQEPECIAERLNISD